MSKAGDILAKYNQQPRKNATPGLLIQFVQSHLHKSYQDPTWYSGQCANLALGIQTFLRLYGVDSVIEMNPGGGHVRCRVGRQILESPRANIAFAPGKFQPTTREEIVSKNILVTDRRILEVFRDLNKFWKIESNGSVL